MPHCLVSRSSCVPKPYGLHLAMLFALLLPTGCGGGVSAPKTPDGAPVEIMLLFDANIDETADESVKADHRRLASWMEKDLTRRFEEGGYRVIPTTEVEKFEPAKGKFLLTVKIAEYVPASATPRVEAGFGAGTTIIDTYSELFKDNHTIPRFRLKKGSVTARDWSFGAEEVTSNVAKEISAAIRELI